MKSEPIPVNAHALRLLIAEVSLLNTNESINTWKDKNQWRIKQLNIFEQEHFQQEVVFRKRQLRQAPRDAARPTRRNRLLGLPDPVLPSPKRPGRPKKVMSCDIKDKNNDTE